MKKATNRIGLAFGCALVFSMSGLEAFADTFAWNGGSTGRFSDPANWLVSGSAATRAPNSGDTVKFVTQVTLAEEEIELGAGTLTFDIQIPGWFLPVTCNATFTGSGQIALQVGNARGKLVMNKTNSFSGGMVIRSGRLTSANVADPFGSGAVVIDRSAGGTAPLLITARNGGDVNNEIQVVGAKTGSSDDIESDNDPIMKGLVTAEGSLTLGLDYAYAKTYEDVRFPMDIYSDITVTDDGILNLVGGAGQGHALCGRVDARCVRVNSGKALLSSTFSVEDSECVLTNFAEEVYFSAGAKFYGQEIVGSGASAVFVVKGAKVFGPETMMKLLNGAKIQAEASGIYLKGLCVGETAVPEGVWTAADYPTAITGTGSVSIGGFVNAWTGEGRDGDWNDPANWDYGVPTSGTTVRFASNVTFHDCTIDIGADGLTIDCGGEVSIGKEATIIGEGKLTKIGSKALSFNNRTLPNTYAGGTLVKAGQLHFCNSGYQDSTLGIVTAGTGAIELRRTESTCPYIEVEIYNTVTNDILVTGPYAGTGTRSSFVLNNGGSISGRITSNDDDFEISNPWSNGENEHYSAKIGDISAHGHAVRYQGHTSWHSASWFKGNVDASLVFNAGATKNTFAGRMTDPESSYTVMASNNIVRADAYIASKEIVVSNVAHQATLELMGSDSLNPEATVRLYAGAKIQLDAVGSVRVLNLIVDGVDLPAGRYTAQRRPDLISGSGTLRVGNPGLCLIVR